MGGSHTGVRAAKHRNREACIRAHMYQLSTVSWEPGINVPLEKPKARGLDATLPIAV